MVTFIDAHRAAYGVEPICAVLPIAPSTYYEAKARERDPARLPARARADAALRPELQRVWAATRGRYGARTAWKELRREGRVVARCTVTRVFKAMGLRGVVRGRRVTTTVPEPLAHRPQDLVQRNFTATRPNQLWVSDLTYVPTWRGFVYVAFVTDAYSRRIVGWRATTTLRTDLALDALEQALYDRALDGPLVHAVLAFQRVDRHAHLVGRLGDDRRQLASAEAHRRHPVATDHRGRGVDGVDDVVERPGELVDVLAVNRRDEGAVQALDYGMCDAVALVLDLLDLLRRLPVGRVARQHAVEQPGRAHDLIGQGQKIGVELLFARDEAKPCHRGPFEDVRCNTSRTADQFTTVTLSLHCRYGFRLIRTATGRGGRATLKSPT